jgi:hypothetical protein
MARVRFEIDEVTILRPKKQWRLYFIIMTEHPTEADKMVITTLPVQPFRLTSRHDNTFAFDTEEQGSEGLYVLSREMPDNREVNVHVYLRHTRSSVRSAGQIMADLESGLGGAAFGVVTSIVGLAAPVATPWLVVAKSAISLVGQLLTKIPDRDFGFLSAFERFGQEFEEQTEVDRKKEFSGDATLVYSWSVESQHN